MSTVVFNRIVIKIGRVAVPDIHPSLSVFGNCVIANIIVPTIAVEQ